MMRPLLALTFALAPLLSACSSGVCTVNTVGDMPILNTSGSPIVRVTLNGKPAAMIVDSGAAITTVWADKIAPYHPTKSFGAPRLSGVQGSTLTDMVVFDRLGLGSATSRDLTVPALATPGPRGTIAGLPVVGLFGEDFLENYDTAFDMSAHRFNLYEIHNCGDYQPGWTGRTYSVPYTTDPHGNAMIIPFALNGRSFKGILDSGAGRTLITQDEARESGLTDAQIEAAPAHAIHGIGTRETTSHSVVFKTMTLGALVAQDMTLDVSTSSIHQTLVGADVLKQLRVWIARDTTTIYFQPADPQTARDPSAPLIITKSPAP